MSGLDDIIARDSGATAQPSGLDALIAKEAAMGGAPGQPAPSVVAPPSPSLWDETARQLGLTARAAATGLTSVPTMVGDALNTALNYGINGVNSVVGTHIPEFQMPSAVVQTGLDAAGLPQPENGAERVAQSVATSMAGVPSFVKLGQALMKTASPVISAVGSGMAQLPGMQITGAAGAGAGGAIAKEAGLGTLGQIAGSLAGGGIGAVSPSAGIAAARAVASAPNEISAVVKPITNPQQYVGEGLARTLGEAAPDVLQAISTAPEYVPGSKPTTAQVGATPTLVATEKSLANASPDFKIALANREAENNAARWNVLSGVAQTPEALDAAKAARDAAASPLYDAAHMNTANVGPGFINFARRPAVQEAMQIADQMARNEGVTIRWPTPDDRAIDGRALDYTARALGDMIDAAKRSGNNQQARALTEAQTYLKNWTSQYVPGVKEAAQVYAQQSIPVNTMEAGQQISNTLGTRALAPNGIPMITLAPYKNAFVQAIKAQPYGIEEGAAKSLQGIGQDLQRATISNSLRSPGSDTAYNIAANGWLARQLYGQNFNGAGAGAKAVGALAAAVTGHPVAALGIIGGGNKAGQFVANRLNEQLADLMLNPEKLAPYLAGRGPVAPAQQALAEGLRRNVNGGALGAAGAVRSRP